MSYEQNDVCLYVNCFIFDHFGGSKKKVHVKKIRKQKTLNNEVNIDYFIPKRIQVYMY